MIKRGLVLLLTVLLLFSSSGCAEVLNGSDVLTYVYFLYLVANSDDSADKDAVFQFVRENEEQLRQAIEAGDFSEFENKGFIKTVSQQEEVVDFSCGGAGIGSATSYVGFFYTPDNDMTDAWCAPPSAGDMTSSGNGYEWREQGGDNRYYAEKICENFYYYEASF